MKRNQLVRKLGVSFTKKLKTTCAYKVNEYAKCRGMSGEGISCPEKEAMGNSSAVFMLPAFHCELATETGHMALI